MVAPPPEDNPVNKVLKAVRQLAPLALAAAALLLPAPAPAATPAPQTLELGKGPTIVIVHGLGGSRTSWMPTARRLIGARRVVLVDLPGHGGSALPDPFSFEAAAEDLDQVLARQNPDSTVLVGHGVGGMLLLQDLKVHPERARGLVLVDASLRTPIKIEDPEQIKAFNRMLDERYDDFVKMVFSHAGRDSAEGVRVRALAAQVPPVTMKSYYRTIFTSDVSGAFKGLKIPVLYVASDRLLKDSDWPTVGKLLGFDDPASVPLRRIAGSGALLMQDEPDSLAAVLSDFSARVVAKK